MTQDEYLKAIARENARVTHEWDRFMAEHGESWSVLSEQGKAIACDLAEKQGIRSNQLKERYEKAHEETHPR